VVWEGGAVRSLPIPISQAITVIAVILRRTMEIDDSMDEIITQHAIYTIMDSGIIPCNCGEYRKITQNKNPELLETECSKCGAKEPFNISDLAFIGGALLVRPGKVV
jgi:hypothetical protein